MWGEILGMVPLYPPQCRPATASASALQQAWKRLTNEAISRFFEKGLSVPEVALISGHRDYRQLFRYTHLRAEDIVQRLD